MTTTAIAYFYIWGCGVVLAYNVATIGYGRLNSYLQLRFLMAYGSIHESDSSTTLTLFVYESLFVSESLLISFRFGSFIIQNSAKIDITYI